MCTFILECKSPDHIEFSWRLKAKIGNAADYAAGNAASNR